MEQRYLRMHDIQTREDESASPQIEGYFAVFGDIYEVWPGATESIAPGAFTESISQDVRALYNHNPDLVLGRSSAGTLQLKEDSHGLWGCIRINREDSDAMNVYQRIKRGDITGCSFGFDIEKESREDRVDGTVHYTIERVNPLYEISPCVFPAYEATKISARGKDLEQIRKRKVQAWRDQMIERLRQKGANEDGTESTDAPEKD